MTEQPLSQKRILVVDDEAMVCEVIAMMLNFGGCEVVTASSGSAALALFEQGKFDVVITDFHMPGMNGSELARAVKARLPGQPVIMITADVERLKAVAGALADVDQLISKPFQLQELKEAVEKTTAR